MAQKITEKRVRMHSSGIGMLYLPKSFVGVMVRIDTVTREMKVIRNKSITPMQAEELKAYLKKIEMGGLQNG